MTICNMSIEGGARAGLVAPDETTFAYLKGRPHAPQGRGLGPRRRGVARAPAPTRARRSTTRSCCDGADIVPHVTWGTNPAQSVPITGRVPDPETLRDAAARETRRALARRTWTSRPARRSRRSRSIASSSAPARTRASRTCAPPPKIVAGKHVASTVTRDGGARLGPREARRPRRKASTRSSSTPASSGATPAARCASA